MEAMAMASMRLAPSWECDATTGRSFTNDRMSRDSCSSTNQFSRQLPLRRTAAYGPVDITVIPARGAIPAISASAALFSANSKLSSSWLSEVSAGEWREKPTVVRNDTRRPL